MKNKITVFGVLGEGFKLGLKNALSIICAVILWLLTIWVPYINVGTTIALCAIPVALAQGKTISPLFIFESKYRKLMGEFFLLVVFIYMAMIPLLLFLAVPAFVVGIAWSLAVYLLIDKGLAPGEALVKSNKLTYGYKWRIFGISVILSLIPMLCCCLIDMEDLIDGCVSGWIAVLIIVVCLLVHIWCCGCNAIIYRNLSADETCENADGNAQNATVEANIEAVAEPTEAAND